MQWSFPGETLRKGKSDTIVKVGGDEFVVMFPETD